MKHRIASKWAIQLALLASLSANAQTSTEYLGAEQIRRLVSGKTLALRFPGVPPSDPKFFSHWDFRTDGSLCGRLIGSKVGTECADLGVWKVQDNKLCWALPRIGTTSGINAVCGTVRDTSDGAYELLEDTGRVGTVVFGIAR